jgi:hypothetical protein
MARKKTAYRPQRFRDGGAVSAPLHVEIDTPAAHIAADAATADLLEAVAPDSREAIIQRWQKAGLTDHQAGFLRENPELIDDPGTLEAAVAHARMKGHEIDSPQYFDEVRGYADRHLGPPPKDEYALDDEPYQPSKSESLPDDYEPPSRSRTRSIVSAPVSKDWGYSATSGAVNGERPGQVHMTPGMKEAAKMSGLTELEYAQQVIELRRRKSEGDYGGSP